MAIHWSGDASAPDGLSATWELFWAFAGITLALTLGTIALIMAGPHFRSGRLSAMITSLTGGILATAWIASAWATVDAPAPAEASLGARPIILAAAAVVAALVFLLTPPGASRAIEGESETDALELAPGERVAWSTRISSPLFTIIAVALVALASLCAIVGATSNTGGMLVGVVTFGIAALSTLALTPVQLTVDHRGIRLTSVILRIPLVRVGLASIENVTTDTIEPGQWGGWGYRISGSGRAYITRRGPGIIIYRHNASPIAITVPDPQQAAATANALTPTA
ncbi:hypothetical protein QN358_03285 [Subtercola sp. RTI3]|nr:hypothetical protein [Subtercola sp. RTI3]